MKKEKKTIKQPKVVGRQLWRENDNRYERYVVVVTVPGASAFVRTVDKNARPVPHGRSSYAALERFDGRHTGYSFVRKLTAAEFSAIVAPAKD